MFVIIGVLPMLMIGDDWGGNMKHGSKGGSCCGEARDPLLSAGFSLSLLMGAIASLPISSSDLCLSMRCMILAVATDSLGLNRTFLSSSSNWSHLVSFCLPLLMVRVFFFNELVMFNFDGLESLTVTDGVLLLPTDDF